MELCPKPMLPSGYCEVSHPDSPIFPPSHLIFTIYREVFVAKLLAVQRVTLVLHDAVVTAALQCTIWWRPFCMCCITVLNVLYHLFLPSVLHSAVLNPTTSLLVTICFQPSAVLQLCPFSGLHPSVNPGPLTPLHLPNFSVQ